MSRYKSSQAGFTLVEIAIVLLIGAIVLASAGGMIHVYIQHERMRITQDRIQEIDDALVQYLNTNGVLPCVAGMSDPPDTNAFGVQITVAGGGHGPPSGVGSLCNPHAGGAGAWTKKGLPPPSGGGPGNIIIGAVPVFTLGLPDQDIADAWGNRFAYAVTEALTMTGKYSQTEGVIEVKDSSGTDVAPVGIAVPTTVAPAAQYAIISFGADGAGSYTLAGVKNGLACPAGEIETPNCNILKPGGGPFGNLVMTMQNSGQAGTAFMFDDYVIFHTMTPSTGITPMGVVAPIAAGSCPSGWQTYAGPPAVCTPSAPYICCQKY